MANTAPGEKIDDLYTIDSKFLGHEGHVAVYLLDAEKPILLDTAASTCTETVLDAFGELPLTPDELEFVFVSHLHLDHAGGAGYLLETFENASVLVPEEGFEFLVKERKIRNLVESAHRATGELASGYGDLKPIPADRVQTLRPGDEIDLGDRSLEVLEAPGHTGHQCGLFEPESRWLYTADEVGLWLRNREVPATPPPDFNLESTLDSLRRFRTIQPEFLVYPHFGVREDAMVGLRNYERILRDWVRSVREAREELDTTEAVVAAMVDRTDFYPELWDSRTRRQIIQTDTTGVLGYLNQKDGSNGVR